MKVKQEYLKPMKRIVEIERKRLIKEMNSWGGKVIEFAYTPNISSSMLKKKLKKL